MNFYEVADTERFGINVILIVLPHLLGFLPVKLIEGFYPRAITIKKFERNITLFVNCWINNLNYFYKKKYITNTILNFLIAKISRLFSNKRFHTNGWFDVHAKIE